ncbi:MAG: hypothetical protein U0Z26_09540 [Anaerolineales bacterium]
MNRKNIGRRDFFKIAGGALSISAISYYLGLRDKPDAVVPDGYPDYVDGGIGLPVFRGPYLQKDVNLAAFLYNADINTLTALCDQTLNQVPSSPFKYIPLMANVILVYADMLVSSLDERDTQVGLIPETEVSFWVLTLAMQKTSTGEIAHHLAWFLPTLLVDEANAIATGREVYGFNKQAGTFEKPQDIQSPSFTANVLGFKQFSQTAIAQKERLLELHLSSSEGTQSSWNDWSTAKDYFVGELLKNIRPDLGASVVGFVAQALVNHIPLVFLKQLRSASTTEKAIYQKIVEAPLQIENFYSGSMLTQSYELNISHLESHPVAEKLGLQLKQSTNLAAWLKVDFILDSGIEY